MESVATRQHDVEDGAAIARVASTFSCAITRLDLDHAVALDKRTKLLASAENRVHALELASGRENGVGPSCDYRVATPRLSIDGGGTATLSA